MKAYQFVEFQKPAELREVQDSRARAWTGPDKN